MKKARRQYRSAKEGELFDNFVGVFAYKFESPYFDGSSAEAQIVNVPEERLIRMSLSLSGFQVLAAITPEKNFYSKKYQKLRGVKESFIFARKDYSSNLNEIAWKAKAQLYESIFTFGLLELEILSYWINVLKLHEIQNKVSTKSIVRKNWLKSKILFHYSKNPTSKWLTLFARSLDISKVDLEILSAISRSPRDKILLELAKHGIINKRYEVAIAILERILDSEGADWRSFYRAAYLLCIIHLITNNAPMYTELKELLLVSNSDWPLTDAEGLNWALGTSPKYF